MFTINNKVQMVAAATVTTAFALCGMLLHMKLNYEPEMQELVRVRGTFATITVSFPLSLFFMYQMLRLQNLTKEMQRLVRRDRLTDVATRDFFFERLNMDQNMYGVSLMIDIDNFKRVNDSFGHFIGDDVIRLVADVLREQVREEDIICRFGGEEFVVFLKSASAQEGWIIAERIRRATEAASTPTDGGEVKVTVSVGGSMKDSMEHVDAAIKRADECLYRAKSAGRNCTMVDWRAHEEAA